MARPHSILVAYKKSRYEQYVIDEGDEAVARLIAENHISVRRLLASHERHTRSLEAICAHLDARGLTYDAVYRGDVEAPERYELVIAVGGDGTVLDLSHQIEDVPVLAINSDPVGSVGYFSAGTAHDFPDLLERTLEDRWQPAVLTRFAIRINGTRIGSPVLNDVLVAHENPAAVAHYLLKVGNHPFEEQKSSGIWVSTPAGSTGAIRSAGGLVMPFASDNIQYLVREPYPPATGGYRFLRGIQPVHEPFEVISRMKGGRVFVDGPHTGYPFTLGDTLNLDDSAPPLRIYGLEEDRRTA